MKPLDIATDIVLRIVAFCAAIGIGFVIILTAIIMYPIYYYRVTIVAIIIILGSLAYISASTNGYPFVL